MNTNNSHTEPLEDQSARQIEKETQRTRAEMDSTLNKLGERLEPRNLLDDLIGAVRGDGSESNGESISSSLKSAGRSAAEIVRRHPGPAMLLGAGALWWMLEQRDDDHAQGQRPAALYGNSPPEPASWHQEVPAWHEGYVWENSPTGSKESWTERAKQALSDLTSSDGDQVPAGERIRSTAAKLLSLSGHKRKEIHARWSSLREHSGSFVDARTGKPYDKDYGAHWRNLLACDTIAGDYEASSDDSYTDKASECWQSVKSRLNDASLSVQDKVKHLSDLISEYSSQTGRQVKSSASRFSDTASDWADSTRQGVTSAGQHTLETAQAMGQTVSDSATVAAKQLKRGAEVTRAKVDEAMNEYPLAVGAACFGIGLLGGLLVPRTRYEDELMGETADDLKEATKEAVEEAVEHGKQVAAETASTAMSEAERQGLTPAQVAESARESVSAVKDAVVSEADRQATDTNSFVDGVSEVARAAKDKAKESTREHVEQAKA